MKSEDRKITIGLLKKTANVEWKTLREVVAVKTETNTMIELKHLKNDFYEKSSNSIVVVIYVRDIKKESLKVDFRDESFGVTFQSNDGKFLSLHPNCNEESYFHWSINLKDKIIPESCDFNLTKAVLNLVLKKRECKRWAVLEAPQDNSQGIIVPSNTWVPVAHSTVSKEKKIEDEEDDLMGMKGDGDTCELLSPETTPAAGENIKKKPTCMVSPLNKIKPELLSPIGLTGLENLGNTCFMNSVLQCLVNTQEFKQYFLGNNYIREINEENPLGTGGKLASAFAVLMRTLWSGNHKYFSPSKLKSLIAMKANQFTGFLQHDAQEFMAFLLDGLHEDLNRIKDKPYTPSAPETLENRADKELADEAWKLHKSRNDSVVVDLFQGQYKSKLVCPVCSKVSITFDPFLYLAVPLPKKKRTVEVTYFSRDSSRHPIKYYLRLNHNAVAGELFDELANLTLVPVTNLRIFEVLKSKVQKPYSRHTSLDQTSTATLIFAFEVLDEALAGEPVKEITVIQRVAMPLKITKCCQCKRDAPPDEKLKRCTNCYRAAYCNHNCQRQHWQTHKSNCKLLPEGIGYPFIISLPKSQVTYAKLSYMMEAYARYSVHVFQPPVDLKEPLGCNLNADAAAGRSSIVSNSSSTITSVEAAAAMEKENEGDNSQEDDGYDTGSGTPTTPIARMVVGQPQEKITERSNQTFLIRCVNQSGNSVLISKDDKIEDIGDQPINLPTRYLVMEWQNNEKLKNYVLVESKELDFVSEEERSRYLRDEQSNFTLHQCMQLFTEPETLAPDEAWYCPRCKEHREATKEMSLWRLPNILIVQLKRFSFKNLILRDKIDKPVDFPVRSLDLSPYICEESDNNESPIYDLYAVINHHGTILGGHYTALARLVSQQNTRQSEFDWRLFDDSRVTFVPESRVMTSAGYVLFYRRRGTMFQMPAICDESISTPVEESEAEETSILGSKPLKLECGDFSRPLNGSSFSDMEAVD